MIIYLILFAALVIGVALVFVNISLQHLVASLGDAEQRTRNVSLQSLAISLGAMTQGGHPRAGRPVACATCWRGPACAASSW